MSTTNADLERQIAELRIHVNQLATIVSKNDVLGSENAREIGALNAKLDNIRDDLKEIKVLSSSYIQRPEIESRLQLMKERVDHVDASVKTLDTKVTALGAQVSQGFIDVRKDQTHVLTVLYGTIVTILMAAVANISGFLK